MLWLSVWDILVVVVVLWCTLFFFFARGRSTSRGRRRSRSGVEGDGDGRKERHHESHHCDGWLVSDADSKYVLYEYVWGGLVEMFLCRDYGCRLEKMFARRGHWGKEARREDVLRQEYRVRTQTPAVMSNAEE